MVNHIVITIYFEGSFYTPKYSREYVNRYIKILLIAIHIKGMIGMMGEDLDAMTVDTKIDMNVSTICTILEVVIRVEAEVGVRISR